MTLIADLLAERGLATARFEFAYMARVAMSGKRRPPPKAETLSPEYEAAVDAAARALAGPSAADRRQVDGRARGELRRRRSHSRRARAPGSCASGYPFHPPAKPEQLRTAHLMRRSRVRR